MSESGKERFILTKSYEIAYALFRVAGTIKEADFAERLRTAGAGLLEAAALQDHKAARNSLHAIECFVKFAGDVNLLTPSNSDMLLREVYVLDAAVVERLNAAKASSLDLSEVFSKEAPDEEAEDAVAPIAGSPEPTVAPNTVAEQGIAPGFIKAEMRQSAILDMIRQSGNCRMKDIQEILPGCSERTIRYDLQSLMEKDLIERIGNGGPAVSYRMRQSVGQDVVPMTGQEGEWQR